MRRPSLNHSYRLIWSKTHKAFIAVGETVRSNRKSGTTRSGIVAATVATLAFGCIDAMAVDLSWNTANPDINVASGSTVDHVLALPDNFSGSMVNNGTITAVDPNGGVDLEGSTIVANIINNGSITSATRSAISLYNQNAWISVLTGDITNHGVLTGQIAAIEVNGGSIFTGNIHNDGTITGEAGIKIVQSTLNGSVNNSGIISGTGDAGIRIDGSTINGDIKNASTGNISGSQYGVYIGTFEKITTFYLLNPPFNQIYGPFVPDSATCNSFNGFFGSGACTPTPIPDSITSTFNGSIINAGTIGGAIGVTIVSGSSITGGISNQAGGLIEGTSGIAMDLTGAVNTIDVTNAGTSATSRGTIAGAINGNANVTNNGLWVMPEVPATVGSTVSGSYISSTIDGNFTQGSNGTLRIGAFDTSNYSKLTVGGSATLGGTLNVDVKPMSGLRNSSGATYNFVIGDFLNNVISASGSITGTFSSITDNSFLFDFTPIYSTQHVDLTIIQGRAVLDAVTATGNNPATGSAVALDTIIGANPGGPIGSLFVPFTTQQQVSNAASQTLPLLTGGQTQAMGNALHGTNRIIQARQEGQHGRSSGDSFLGDEHAWFKPFGSWTNQDDRKGVSGYDATTYGMVFGADAALSDDNRLGVAFAYAHSNVNSNSSIAPQDSNVNSYQLVVYGSHNISDSTDINFQADVGQHSTKGSRSLGLLLPGQAAKSDYDSWSGHIGAGVAHTYSVSDKTTLTSLVRADYTRVRDDGYNENGAGALNLNVNSNTTEELILSLDGKLAHALTDKATLTANLGVGYDVINDQASITSAFAGAPSVSFTTKGLDPSPWLMRGGLGIVSKATETIEISARYDIEARKDFDNQTASVKVRWAF